MRILAVLFLVAGTTACFDYEAFQRQQIEESCKLAEECNFLQQDSVADCVADGKEDVQANSTCDGFNADVARDCIEEYSEIDDCFDLADILDLGVCAGVCAND